MKIVDNKIEKLKSINKNNIPTIQKNINFLSQTNQKHKNYFKKI